MIRNKYIALAYRIAALLFAVAGFLALLGVFQGEVYGGVLFYYTAQSNILVIALFVLVTVRTANDIRKGPRDSAGEKTPGSACYYPRITMVCTIDILVTFGVYWVLLVPYFGDTMYLWSFGNLAVHAITPLLCLLDYILFTEPRRLKYRDVYYVAIFPLCYVGYSSLAGLAGHVYGTSAADGAPVRFPYFFFDFDRIGALAIAYIAGLLVVFFLIGHVFYFFDKRVRNR